MTLNHDEKAREISRIIDAVYIHGTREGDNPGSRLDITALPEDEITIATALKSLNKLLKEVEEEAIERCANAATHWYLKQFRDTFIDIFNKDEFIKKQPKEWRDGSKIREAILNIQGLEPEFKADLESKIRSLENSVAHYKKYYDWYFRIYHCDRYPRENGQESLMQHVERLVGSPDKQLPKETP